MIGNDIESRGDESKANKLNSVTAERLQLLSEIPGFCLSSRLSLNKHEGPVFSSQGCEFSERDVLGRYSLALNAVVWIEKDEVGVTDGFDQVLCPHFAQ